MKTTTVDYRSLGNRLRVFRILLGLTDVQAAEAAGISLRTWRGYEEGHPIRKFRNIADFVFENRGSLDWLADGEGGGIDRRLNKGRIAILPVTGPRMRRRPLTLAY